MSKRQYILVDPFTRRPYLVTDRHEALTKAVEMNKANPNHPAFILYKTDFEGRGLYEATLARKFGTEEFYWDKKIKP